MTTRRPLILVSGGLSELPPGDVVAGVSIGLVAEPSGLYVDPAGDFGFDGSAQALAVAAQSSADTALASGVFAQSSADTALASGNAALTILDEGVGVSLGVVVALS